MRTTVAYYSVFAMCDTRKTTTQPSRSQSFDSEALRISVGALHSVTVAARFCSNGLGTSTYVLLCADLGLNKLVNSL